MFCGGDGVISRSGAEILHSRRAAFYPLLLLFLLIVFFLVDNLVFGPRIGGLAGNYLWPTLMWGLMIVCTFRLPAVRTAGKMRQRRLLRWLAAICVLIAVLAVVLEGLLGGFGRSPYDRSLLGIAVNFTALGTVLVAVERCRSWLVNRFFRRRPLSGISGVALLFTLLQFPLNKLLGLSGGKAMVQFVGTQFFPDLAENILATYFAFLGGPLPAIIYRGGMLAFERLSPVLPGSSWVAATLIGTITPLISLILVQQIYREETGTVKASHQGAIGMGWFAASLASVLILWFCAGVFSYAPRVILSGSMTPTMKIGDVVIVRDVPGSQVQEGDIIMFPVGGMKVTHRIVGVEDLGDQRGFITKGDANQDLDSDIVPESHVLGRVVMVIPKAGWLTMALRGWMDG